MNKYAQSALRALRLYNESKVSPLDAWNQATSEYYEKGSSSQRKDCPRYAFLGLCEVGLVKGVPEGNYTYKPNSLNKVYAVKAVELLRVNPELANDKKELWNKVNKGVKKSHNSQIDVVLALWNNDLIVSE